MEFKSIAQAKKDIGVSYLGGCGTSSKIKKNFKVLNIDTYILYLAPHKASGYNVCPMATKDCIAGCLNTSGRAGMEIKSNNNNNIMNARIAKTKLFFEDKEYFMRWLIAEIKTNKAKSERKGHEFAVRLNGTSDINWIAYKIDGKTIFEHFPSVQFYDYTKVAKKFNNMPKNYHLTFSYTGYNWDDCERILNNGGNIAVVFNIRKFYNSVNASLPVTFKGYEVIDGDITDYRPFDKKGVIVGLHWKEIANKKDSINVRNSPFVVDVNNNECSYLKEKAA